MLLGCPGDGSLLGLLTWPVHGFGTRGPDFDVRTPMFATRRDFEPAVGAQPAPTPTRATLSRPPSRTSVT